MFFIDNSKGFSCLQLRQSAKRLADNDDPQPVASGF
jgi:hypothetical protein